MIFIEHLKVNKTVKEIQGHKINKVVLKNMIDFIFFGSMIIFILSGIVKFILSKI